MSKIDDFTGEVYDGVPELSEATNDFFKANRSAAFTISDWGPSLTRQEFADECDINSLMERYETPQALLAARGVPPEANYADLTVLPENYQEALNQLNAAQASFMTLPAKVRREFDNDPALFVEFASNPDNLDQLRDWGLAKRPDPIPDAKRELPPVEPTPAPKADK